MCRIVTPQHNQFRITVIGSRRYAAKSESVSGIFMPVTYFSAVAGIRAAVVAHKTFNPLHTVDNWGPTRRGYPKRYRFCTTFRFKLR